MMTNHPSHPQPSSPAPGGASRRSRRPWFIAAASLVALIGGGTIAWKVELRSRWQAHQYAVDFRGHSADDWVHEYTLAPQICREGGVSLDPPLNLQVGDSLWIRSRFSREIYEQVGDRYEDLPYGCSVSVLAVPSLGGSMNVDQAVAAASTMTLDLHDVPNAERAEGAGVAVAGPYLGWVTFARIGRPVDHPIENAGLTVEARCPTDCERVGYHFSIEVRRAVQTP